MICFLCRQNLQFYFNYLLFRRSSSTRYYLRNSTFSIQFSKVMHRLAAVLLLPAGTLVIGKSSIDYKQELSLYSITLLIAVLLFLFIFINSNLMENQSLRKRLYQNLSQRPLKHTFLLETEMKDPKSSHGILKPKILQESIGELKNLSNSFAASPNIPKMADSDKKQKPKKVQVQKLSKEAKTIVEDGKCKIRTNLKPLDIFAFYDAFPEMIEDFFYLNRLSHPYDYQIVSYAKRNHREYMTISSQGVTLYHDKQAEFLTREEWLADEKIYHQLQKIDFFSQYKVSKNFMIWKNKMKRHYMKSMSNILSEKLFFTSEEPRKCLISVRSICLNLEENQKLLPSNHIQTFNWKELVENINHYLSTTLTKEICKHEHQIVSELEKAINLQIANFKESNKIKIDGLNSQEENKQGYIYSQEAILRKQYKRVLKLIKLAESLLLESKITLFNIWLEEILERLNNIKDSNSREEWLTISFVAMPPSENSTAISWNPSYENFINIFKNIIDKAIEEICKKHDKIMNHSIFEKYRNSDDQSLNKDDRHNYLKNLIEESDFYQNLMSKIRDRLQQEFEHVTEQGKYLNKYIEIYNKHKNMLSLETIVKESTVAELAIYVQEWKEDNEQMKDLADKCMGMIKFDFSLMRKQMMNIAGDSYTRLFALLPNHLGELCQLTSERARQLLEPLDVSFNSQKFVEYTKNLKKAAENLESITEQGFEIKRLEMLMSENKSSSIDPHKKNLMALPKLIEQLSKAVIQAQIAQNKRLSDFKTQNQEKVKQIKNSIKQYSEAVEKLEVEQKHLTIEQMIKKVSQILNNVAEIDIQAININVTENELSLPETDFSESHRLHNVVKMLSSLWNQKQKWEKFNRQRATKHYTEIDYENDMKSWTDFNTEITKIKQYLDQNEHLDNLVTEINNSYNELQLIKALQSKSLTAKSWNQISEFLKFEFSAYQYDQSKKMPAQPFKDPKNPIYTIEWLKQNKMSLYKESIQLIVKNSQKESHLSSVLVVLKNYINNLTLRVVTKKGDLNLLADNSIVFQQLSEHLAALIEIFNEEYSESLKKETKLLVKHYEYVIEILQSYRDFSANWEKYEELFDPLKHYSKQLSKQSKDFATLEVMWKKLSKGITSYDWSKKVYDETLGSNPNRNTMKLVYKANLCWQQIKKGVDEFLDRRRNIFHHYYYLSDDQLLLLMKKLDSNSSLNNIVPVIYQNIKKINVDSNSDTLISVVNKEGEELKILKLNSSKTGLDYEDTLKNYEEQWKKSLISLIKKVIENFISSNEDEISRQKIVLQNITQVVLAFDNIVWVKLAEQTYLCPEPVGLLTDWIAIQNTQISDLKQLLKNKLSEVQRKKIELVLIQLIYLRDKTEHFYQTRTQSLDSYEWERTLKLYDGTASLHEKIYLKAIDSTIYYGGEFLGLSDFVYIAPETERSYLNIIQLVNDRQIGVISSASHNTSLIKSFSSLVAQNFRKFSFCQGVNHKMISRILSGICSQGLWSCLSIPQNWEIVSFLASYLSIIEKCIKQNTYNTQINKHSVNINQNNLPVFFIRASPGQLVYLNKVPKLNYRPIEFVTPSMKTILAMHLQNYERGQQIAETISEAITYCQKVFKCQYYDEFGTNFALKILKEMRLKPNQGNENIHKKLRDSLLKLLNPKMKDQDQLILEAFIRSFNYEGEPKIKVKKSATYDNSLIKSKLGFNQNQSLKYGQNFIKNVSNFEQIVIDSEENGKNIVVVGPSFSGKTSIIKQTRNKIQKQFKKSINLNSVYFMAYKDSQLMSANEKGHGIITKCIKQKNENWVVLDGPLNDKYLNLFGKISNEAAFSNYGVISNRSKVKFILETTDLSKLSPSFVNYVTAFYVEENEKNVQEIVKGGISAFLYKQHEEQIRTQTKGDQNTQFQVKAYRIQQKPMKISKDLIDYLICQIVTLIEKLAPRGSVKIKSVEMLYEISSAELASKCSKLVQSVFLENWDTINEKVTRKCIEKFAIWVVMWSVSAVVSPNDYEKLEKAMSEIAKSNQCEGILESIVFPGTGLQIHPAKSPRAQNSLSSNCGAITNIVNKYELLISQDKNLLKNKFYSDFYCAEPNRLRVITEESIIYSYFVMLNRHSKTPVALYGPPASGKKSNIDVFNSSYEQAIESFTVRFKKYDPYFIGKQLQKPFNKFQSSGKTILKPSQISKRIHISIDDVSMTPYHEPSTELLRMVADTNSLFDDKCNLAEFRQMLLTLTVNQINSHNFEGVDFKRLLSKLFILQTSEKSKQSLISIFRVILVNLLETKPENRDLLMKNGENVIVSSTMYIYSFVQGLVNTLPTNNILEMNKKLLLAPRMGDICNVISNICKIDEVEDDDDIKYCAEMWAHEISRVFADKFQSVQDARLLYEQIKKYSLMQFKHDITMCSNLIFTNICKQVMDNEEAYPYIKHNSIERIKKQIEEIYCSESISDELPYFTDEMIKDLIKIYRVLNLEGGNLLLVTPFKKHGKFMIKIANFLNNASIYHDIENGELDFEKNLAPSIIKNASCTLLFDIQTVKQQALYQLTCLANRNSFDFEISPEIKEKIKVRLFALVQENQKKQEGENLSNTTNTNINIKTKLAPGQAQDNLKSSQIPNRVEAEFVQISIDCLSDYIHIATCVHPSRIETTKFLNENNCLVKTMQIYWHEFKDQTLNQMSQKMIAMYPQDSIQSDQQFLKKCMKIYQVLSEDQKSVANFYKYHDNCCRIHENLTIKLSDQIEQYEQCLEVLNRNSHQIEEHKLNSKRIQENLQEIVKNKEQLSALMKNAQQSGALQELANLETKMKKIKQQKQTIDLQSREYRNLEKMSQSFGNLLPQKEELQQKLRVAVEIMNKSQQYSILVETAMLYLNNADEAEYIAQFKSWQKLLNQVQVESLHEIIQIFSKIYETEFMKVPGWHNFSPFTQLKGFHFCQNFMQIPQSAFGTEPIVVDDSQQVLVKLLSKMSSPSYPTLKLLSYFSDKKEKTNKKQAVSKNTRAQVFSAVQKEIFKALSDKKQDIRNEDKYDLKKGIIILGQNNKWQPNRNDIDIFEKKLLRQRRIVLNSRVIIKGKTSPNITFHSNKDDLRFALAQKSMQMEFGDSLVNQNNKIETLLRQHHIIEEQKNEILIERSLERENQELVLQNIENTQKELQIIKNDKAKMTEILLEPRRSASDAFLIDWILSFTNNSSQWTFQRVIEIYEFIKRCLMELNSVRQDKIDQMSKIDEEIVKNWEKLIKANLVNDQQVSLEELVKFTMPLEQTNRLILIPHSATIQLQVQQILSNCPYRISFVDMNIVHSCGETPSLDQDSKNLWIFDKLVAENPSHLSLFIDHFEKNRNTYCPIALIITNNVQLLKQNPQLNETFKVRCKTIPKKSISIYQQLACVEAEEHREKKNNAQLSKTSKKVFTQDLELSVSQSFFAENDQEIRRIKQAIKKFISIYIGARKNEKCYLSLKGIGDRIDLMKSYETAKGFLKDMILHMPASWHELLSDLLSPTTELDVEKSNQIQALNSRCIEYLQNLSASSEDSPAKALKQSTIRIPSVLQIDQILRMLPFAFNIQDFKQSNEPLTLWLINEANKLNKKRFFFKKYLQQCQKICKATKLNYWSHHKQFGLELPSEDEIIKLNSDFKVIKKGLEMVGMINGVDASSKDINIKLSMTGTQGQSILSVACQSFDCRSYDGFSEKLVVLQMIKASRKLKLPLSKLKVVWKLVNQQVLIEEQVNGQNCLSLNAIGTNIESTTSQRMPNSKQGGLVKMLIMIYDSTQTTASIVQVSKQPKKEKLRKTKQEQVKSTHLESKVTMVDVPIKLQGKEIGSIKLNGEETNLKYKNIMEEPCFQLF